MRLIAGQGPGFRFGFSSLDDGQSPKNLKQRNSKGRFTVVKLKLEAEENVDWRRKKWRLAVVQMGGCW